MNGHTDYLSADYGAYISNITLLLFMTHISVTARVSELAVSPALLYVRYILLDVLLTLAGLPYGVV